MHRYWPTVFPKDYEQGKFDQSWLKQWAGEIPHSIKVANYQLSKLLKHCEQTGSELLVCSSMGQGAVENTEPLESQVLLTNVKKLMRYIGLLDSEWELKLSMAPLVTITPKSNNVHLKINHLKNIKINDTSITVKTTSSDDIRLDLSLCNQKSITVTDGPLQLDPSDIGVANIHLQDASGSYAYHIPEGILLHYKPHTNTCNDLKKAWTSVSALDFAPSILKKYSVDIPSYMQKESLFLG